MRINSNLLLLVVGVKMDKIDLSEIDIKKMIPLPEREQGLNSVCYKYDSKTIFKRITNPILLTLREEKKIKRLAQIDNGVFCGATALVYINNTFQGYLIDYIPGNKLKLVETSVLLDSFSYMARDFLIKDLCKANSMLVGAIKDLSHNKIVVNDVNSNNILLNCSIIKIIDMDFYRYEPLAFFDIEGKNTYLINYTFYKTFKRLNESLMLHLLDSKKFSLKDKYFIASILLEIQKIYHNQGLICDTLEDINVYKKCLVK